MAVLKGISRSKRSESITGKFMVDTVRGQLRVRAWPKKRGTPKSALQRWWIDWFRQANKLAKYVDAATARRAIELTAGSGMYPRDIILSAMRGRLYSWVDQTGRTWRSMAAIQDISESLDILAETFGSILVRAADRWRGIDQGNVGDVLTLPPAPGVAAWQAPSGGVVQQELTESPLLIDGTSSEYDIDVSQYLQINITTSELVLSASQGLQVLLSIDGGAAYKSGSTDYFNFALDPVTQSCNFSSKFFMHALVSTGQHFAVASLEALRTGQSVWRAMCGKLSTNVISRSGMSNFAGPVTNIKIRSSAGATLDSGTIRLFGIKAI